jgi:hypothetical protein
MARKTTQELRDWWLTANIEWLQPDYARWQQVQQGMTLEEVTALLGPPMRNPHITGKGVYVYGYLQFPLLPAPRWYSFELDFDAGRLFHKRDPFEGVLSVDGKPTKPRIITPPEGAVYCLETMQSRPLVDLRWHPVSGAYPMSYELEFGTVDTDIGELCNLLYPQKTPVPYFITDNLWRCFRVRGVNELGTGEWSDYRDICPGRGQSDLAQIGA